MNEKSTYLFLTVYHRLGHLIYYENDPTLSDIVILKPDWLASAISLVLDDEDTRKANGLIPSRRLEEIWSTSKKDKTIKYQKNLFLKFLRLMERYEISYRVAIPNIKNDKNSVSLIAQLVPSIRPDKKLENVWKAFPQKSSIQQMQICMIKDSQNGKSAVAEGLFFRLIVRLHKFSLGRENHMKSVHWHRGLVIDADYNGMALLEHIDTDIHITVRAAYPERLLAMLTNEVKYLVEQTWKGLKCEIMVPCIEPCGRREPGLGLFNVKNLIESKKQGRPEYPCNNCNQWQDIDALLINDSSLKPILTEELISKSVLKEVRSVKSLIKAHHKLTIRDIDKLDLKTQQILSKVEATLYKLLSKLTNEAKEGPRLFSMVPINRSNFNPHKWTKERFRITLWCEHSHLPLPIINGKENKDGVYEIEISRKWFKRVAPFLKFIAGTLRIVLPVAISGIELNLDEESYEAIEEQLDFGADVINASIEGGEKIGEWLGDSFDTSSIHHGKVISAQGGVLREFHALIKPLDPSFGNLERVINSHQEFLWVHKRFKILLLNF